MKVKQFLKESIGTLIAAIFPILVSFNLINDFFNRYYLLWFILILIIIWAYYYSYKQFKTKGELKQKVAKLENENTILDENLRSLPQSMLTYFSKHFKLGNEERVTLYRIIPDQSFIPVARFSESPVYREFGRSKYPMDEGFIGQCWMKGELKKEGLPSFNNNPEAYLSKVASVSNMPIEVIEKLTMKSSSFYCKRLSYNGDEPLAIIVIESTKTRLRLDIESIRSYLDGSFGKVLIETVKMNSPVGEED